VWARRRPGAGRHGGAASAICCAKGLLGQTAALSNELTGEQEQCGGRRPASGGGGGGEEKRAWARGRRHRAAMRARRASAPHGRAGQVGVRAEKVRLRAHHLHLGGGRKGVGAIEIGHLRADSWRRACYGRRARRRRASGRRRPRTLVRRVRRRVRVGRGELACARNRTPRDAGPPDGAGRREVAVAAKFGCWGPRACSCARCWGRATGGKRLSNPTRLTATHDGERRLGRAWGGLQNADTPSAK